MPEFKGNGHSQALEWRESRRRYPGNNKSGQHKEEFDPRIARSPCIVLLLGQFSKFGNIFNVGKDSRVDPEGRTSRDRQPPATGTRASIK
jgi:hypothetical protein